MSHWLFCPHDTLSGVVAVISGIQRTRHFSHAARIQLTSYQGDIDLAFSAAPLFNSYCAEYNDHGPLCNGHLHACADAASAEDTTC